MPKNNKTKIIFFILVVFVFFGSIFWVALKKSPQNNLKVVFFDIGQGDSIFVEAKNGFQVLIDGGPGLRVLEKLSEQMPFYDKEIDLIILTHPDSDHLFGLLEVLKSYDIKNVLWTGVLKQTAEWEEWIRLIEEEQANILIAQAGQKIIIQEDPLIFLDILYPLESLEGKEVKNHNDASVVARLVFGDNSFLLTGDISQKAEKELIEEYDNLNSKVLKVAHHGSKTSTSFEFVKAVSPKTAVISVGENRWGHPAQEVLQRLEEFGIDILITKEVGDIIFTY